MSEHWTNRRQVLQSLATLPAAALLVRPVLAQAERLEATWHNGIVLGRYKLSSTEVQPAERLLVTLFWETERPLTENYVVFVHLLDETGRLKAQSDSLPRAGAYPTQWWQPGLVVEDTHALTLPGDLPAGVYQLVVGLYGKDDGIRLPLTDGSDNYGLHSLAVWLR